MSADNAIYILPAKDGVFVREGSCSYYDWAFYHDDDNKALPAGQVFNEKVVREFFNTHLKDSSNFTEECAFYPYRCKTLDEATDIADTICEIIEEEGGYVEYGVEILPHFDGNILSETVVKS